MFGAKLGFMATPGGRRLVFEITDAGRVKEALSPRYLAALETLGFGATGLRLETGQRLVASGSAVSLSGIRALFPGFSPSAHMREMTRQEVEVGQPTESAPADDPRAAEDSALAALQTNNREFVEAILDLDEGHVEGYSIRESVLNVDAAVKVMGGEAEWHLLTEQDPGGTVYLGASAHFLVDGAEDLPCRVEISVDGKAIFFVGADRFRGGYYRATADDESQRDAIDKMFWVLRNKQDLREEALWEMGKELFLVGLASGSISAPSVAGELYQWCRRHADRHEDMLHRAVVMSALMDGNPVPSDVTNEYPGIDQDIDAFRLAREKARLAESPADGTSPWLDFTPNEFGYHSRPVVGLAPGYFVAQWSVDEARVIESARGAERAKILRTPDGRWAFCGYWAEKGGGSRFRATGHEFATPEEAALHYNRYLAVLNEPWLAPPEEYAAYGGWHDHGHLVARAVSAGKEVPPEILALYPELSAPKTEEQKIDQSPRASAAVLREFLSKEQLGHMLREAKGEEGEYFTTQLASLAAAVRSMPKSYETDGQGDNAVAHLHYFLNGSDWYITEKDMDDDGEGQVQAYGFVVLNDDVEMAEKGYVSIKEITGLGAELDLHWTPKPLARVKLDLRGEEVEIKQGEILIEAEPEDLVGFGLVSITAVGAENIYFDHEGQSYFAKVGNVSPYEVGPHDFSVAREFDDALLGLDAAPGFVKFVTEYDSLNVGPHSPKASLLHIDRVAKDEGLEAKWYKGEDGTIYGSFRSPDENANQVGGCYVYSNGKANFLLNGDSFRSAAVSGEQEDQSRAVRGLAEKIMHNSPARGEEGQKDLVTPEKYAKILGDEALQLEYQDILDPLFDKRLIDVRNAMRQRGWAVAKGQTVGTKTIDRSVHGFQHTLLQVGAGNNVVGVTWLIDDGTTAVVDDLTLQPEELADRLDSLVAPHEGLVHSAAPGTAPGRKTRKRRAAKADPSKIDDVGEKIGGARKDLAGRRLVLGDLDGMNEIEKEELVVKDKIFPPLDYRAMRDAGVEPEVAILLKLLRDRLPTSAAKVKQRIPTAFHVSRSAANPGRFNYGYSFADCTVEDYVRCVSLLHDTLAGAQTVGELREGLEYLGQLLASSYQAVPSLDFFETEEGKRFILAHQLKDMVSSKVYSILRSPGYHLDWAARMAGHNGWSAVIRDRVALRKEDGTDKIPERPHLKNIERAGGVDARAGKNIRAEDLKDGTACRGIEFGNWLPQDERQSVINHAFDAFHDLATATGLSCDEISLGGSLAMAFGARGTGGRRAALAHYEPARKVINLTRLSGAGSLAHEWGHALDNYLGETIGNGKGHFLSEGGRLSRMPEEAGAVYVAMVNLMQAIKARPKSREEVIVATEDYALERLNWCKGWAAAWGGHGGGLSSETDKEFRDQIHAMITQFEKSVREAGGLDQSSARELEELIGQIGELYKKLGGKPPRKKYRDGFSACADAAVSKAATAAYLRMGGEEPGLQLGSVPTDYATAAKLLDRTRSKEYWGAGRELFARAFECWVFDRLKEKGCRSDYLVHGVEEARFADPSYRGNPYPAGDERVKINECFDALATAVVTFSRSMQLDENTEKVACRGGPSA